jgi:hypothetical protein
MKIKLAKDDAAFIMSSDGMQVYFPNGANVHPGFMLTFLFASSHTENAQAARDLIQAELEMMTKTAYRKIDMPDIKVHGTN